MKCAIDANEGLGVIEISVTGPFSLQEVGESLQEMWARRLQTGIHNVLWDLTGADLSEVSSSELRAVASHQLLDRPELPKGKAALVVSQDYEFGMARAMASFMELSPVEIQIFRGRDVALKWLLEG